MAIDLIFGETDSDFSRNNTKPSSPGQEALWGAGALAAIFIAAALNSPTQPHHTPTSDSPYGPSPTPLPPDRPPPAGYLGALEESDDGEVDVGEEERVMPWDRRTEQLPVVESMSDLVYGGRR